MSERTGQDLNAFDQNEDRFERNQELKWLADFIVNALVVCKHDLQMEDPANIAEVVEIMWKTLDYRNLEDEIENGGAAVHGRFTFLQKSIVDLFTN